MHINNFPVELLSSILELAAEANQHEGVVFTYGFSKHHNPIAGQKHRPHRYVRGLVPPDLRNWDATTAIRSVCREWHSWSLQYCLKSVYLRRVPGNERWAELPLRRESYPAYETVDPSGTAVYRDPYGSLAKTAKFLSENTIAVAHIRRLWLGGFEKFETDRHIFTILKACTNLTSVSMPWTTLRRMNAQDWSLLLRVSGETPLRSLELLSVDLGQQDRLKEENNEDLKPLDSPLVDFGKVRRLKIFGDTNVLPITDVDLQRISRTATNLEEFHLTCLSSISIDGVMAIVKSSRSTLRVLEHSPRSNDGFWHPHPGLCSDEDHLCEVLANCPRLETVSLSMPSVCEALFAQSDVRWKGDFQVRAARLCGDTSRSTVAQQSLKNLLEQARHLVHSKALLTIPTQLYVELFFADYIFEPHVRRVHGDFDIAQALSNGNWPSARNPSSKGPYGSTGLYGKEEEGTFECVFEDEFLDAISRRLLSIDT